MQYKQISRILAEIISDVEKTPKFVFGAVQLLATVLLSQSGRERRPPSTCAEQTVVAVEKLIPAKVAKIKSRHDALQTTFPVFLDIFYPHKLAVWDEK